MAADLRCGVSPMPLFIHIHSMLDLKPQEAAFIEVFHLLHIQSLLKHETDIEKVQEAKFHYHSQAAESALGSDRTLGQIKTYQALWFRPQCPKISEAILPRFQPQMKCHRTSCFCKLSAILL